MATIIDVLDFMLNDTTGKLAHPTIRHSDSATQSDYTSGGMTKTQVYHAIA